MPVQHPLPKIFFGPDELRNEKMEIARTLRDKIVEGPDAASMYRDLASDAKIDDYLQDTPLYDTKKQIWTPVRDAGDDTSLLSASIAKMMDEVNQCLGKRGLVRKAITSDDLVSRNFGPDSADVSDLSNTVMIMAEGPSFEPPRGRKIGYSNIASLIEVHSDAADFSIPEQVYQLAVEERSILANQPNRKYARGAFMTETMATLIHFDCAGACYARPFNYHKHPDVLVRLILGLTTQSEELLGFDTSIHWTHDANGRKADGIMQVTHTDDSGKKHTTIYRNVELLTRNLRDSMVGRATTCWSVEHPVTKEKFFVKDQFHRYGREAEGDLLHRATGVPGVVQVVASEPCRDRVSDMRTRGSEEAVSKASSKRNKIQSRLVMKMYGKPIDQFTSEKELLEALRDVIAAHWRLFSRRGILHCDISFNSILLPRSKAPKGWRGFLIDFNLAILKDELKGPNMRPCGTTPFTSVNVLRALSDPLHHTLVALHHDHHDDLQSIFYVLLLIVLTKENPSTLANYHLYPHINELVSDFYSDCLYTVADAKFQMFCKEKLNLKNVSGYWSESTKCLLQRFFKALKPDVMWREDLMSSPGSHEEQKEAQMHKVKNSDELYKRILGFFDEALWDIEMEGRKARIETAMAALRDRNVNVDASSSHRKRKLQDDQEEHGEAKADGGDEGDDGEAKENEERVEENNKRRRRD